MESDASLAYGVVVTRLENGDWWHGHFVRSDLEYDCRLLGRRTNLLFNMRRFARGVSPRSANFYLTLDGEGIPEELGPVRINGDWGERANDADLKLQGLHIQEHVVPMLQQMAEFQAAMAAIARHQAYGRVADARRFLKLTGEP